MIGAIDDDATGDGVIVCRDGFKATTLDEDDFLALTRGSGGAREIVEVDESTLFCVIRSVSSAWTWPTLGVIAIDPSAAPHRTRPDRRCS